MSRFVLRSTLGAPGPSPGQPAWAASQATSTWKQITSNSIASVGSGDTAITNGWVGACIDNTLKRYIKLACGGHDDYDGNEEYEVDFSVDAPAWVRTTIPSTGTGGDSARNGLGTYADGNMRSSHNSTRTVFAKGRVWIPGLWGMSTGAGGTETTTAIWSWDRSALTPPYPSSLKPFAYHGKGHASIPPSQVDYSGEGGGAFYDPIGDILWSFAAYANEKGGFSVGIANMASVVITPYDISLSGNPFTGAWGVVVAEDSTHRWIIMGSVNETRLRVWDLNNPSAGFRAVNTTGTAHWDGGGGAVYHAPSRKIIIYHHSYGAQLYTLTVPANPYTSASTGFVWGSLTNAGGGATPPGTVDGDFQGIFSQFQYCPDVGGGQPYLFCVFNVTGQLFAYKLPVSI